MPYPEICPECENPFRNSGTHFTARRSEVGRHVLLELGCQVLSQRFWWDFTVGKTTTDGKTAASNRVPRPETRELVGAAFTNGHSANGYASNGQTHLQVRSETLVVDHEPIATVAADEAEPTVQAPAMEQLVESAPAEREGETELVTGGGGDLEQAFLRQLELDRLTLRQMRGWVPSDDTQHSAEVAASATEATYERLSLALFGKGLGQLLGPAVSISAHSDSLSAEERLAIQREKARIRARDRRAAIKAARLAAE